MRILVIETVIDLAWCRSLKDKRRVRQALVDRLTRRYRLSIKEVDCLDIHQTLCLGMAAVVLSENGGHELEASIRDTIENHLEGHIREWDADLL